MLKLLPLLHDDTTYAEVFGHGDGCSSRVGFVADSPELAVPASNLSGIVASGSCMVALFLAHDQEFGLVKKSISVGVAGCPHFSTSGHLGCAELWVGHEFLVLGDACSLLLSSSVGFPVVEALLGEIIDASGDLGGECSGGEDIGHCGFFI